MMAGLPGSTDPSVTPAEPVRLFGPRCVRSPPKEVRRPCCCWFSWWGMLNNWRRESKAFEARLSSLDQVLGDLPIVEEY